MPRSRGSPTIGTASVPTGANQQHARGLPAQSEEVPAPKDQTRDSTTLGRLGPANGRWNGGERITKHGYPMVFVGREHPLADVKGYAYLHRLVWAAAGCPVPGPGEELHHRDGHKTHNRLSNLELTTTAEHARQHAATKQRDGHGRFAAAVAMREVVS